MEANIRRRAAWAAQKPSQADVDTAARVLRWLADHAHYYPDLHGEDAAFDLARAANACHLFVGDIEMHDDPPAPLIP